MTPRHEIAALSSLRNHKQSCSHGTQTITIWKALKLLTELAEELNAEGVNGTDDICKVSLVGVGMRSHAGVASKMFKTLADESINILAITTSEIKISVVIEEKYLELAVRALHTAFGLDAEVTEEH